MNANDLHSIAPADRRAIYEKIRLRDKKENETIKLLDGTTLNFSYSKITTKYKRGNVFIALNYKYGNMPKFEEAIVVKDKSDHIIALPYSIDIIDYLPDYYDKIDEAYKPVDHEYKWWEETEKCTEHLKSLKEKYGEPSLVGDYLDDIGGYLGIKSREKTVAVVAGVGIFVLVGGVWVLKSLLSSVGEVVHGKK